MCSLLKVYYQPQKHPFYKADICSKKQVTLCIASLCTVPGIPAQALSDLKLGFNMVMLNVSAVAAHFGAASEHMPLWVTAKVDKFAQIAHKDKKN